MSAATAHHNLHSQHYPANIVHTSSAASNHHHHHHNLINNHDTITTTNTTNTTTTNNTNCDYYDPANTTNSNIQQQQGSFQQQEESVVSKGEIAFIVLQYLRDSNFTETFKAFQKESHELLQDFDTNSSMKGLESILTEYITLSNLQHQNNYKKILVQSICKDVKKQQVVSHLLNTMSTLLETISNDNFISPLFPITNSNSNTTTNTNNTTNGSSTTQNTHHHNNGMTNTPTISPAAASTVAGSQPNVNQTALTPPSLSRDSHSSSNSSNIITSTTINTNTTVTVPQKKKRTTTRKKQTNNNKEKIAITTSSGAPPQPPIASIVPSISNSNPNSSSISLPSQFTPFVPGQIPFSFPMYPTTSTTGSYPPPPPPSSVQNNNTSTCNSIVHNNNMEDHHPILEDIIEVTAPSTPPKKLNQSINLLNTDYASTNDHFTTSADDFFGSPSFFLFSPPRSTSKTNSSCKRKRVETEDSLCINLFESSSSSTNENDVESFLSKLKYD